jgi:hypothetical protein
MIFVMNIKACDAYLPALIFVFVNLAAITIVVTCGKLIIKYLSISFYIQLSFITLLYSFFQFIHMFAAVGNINLNSYILYHLCVLFVYFTIVVSIVLLGIHNNKLNKLGGN